MKIVEQKSPRIHKLPQNNVEARSQTRKKPLATTWLERKNPHSHRWARKPIQKILMRRLMKKMRSNSVTFVGTGGKPKTPSPFPSPPRMPPSPFIKPIPMRIPPIGGKPIKHEMFVRVRVPPFLSAFLPNQALYLGQAKK